MKQSHHPVYNLESPEFISVIDDLPLWSAPFGLKLLEVVQLKKQINVLDVGSGTGFPLIELSQRLGQTCTVYGIDPWPMAVERVQVKIREWQVSNIKIITGRAEALPFENNFFSLITSNNGINNVQNDRKALAEIFRVSQKGAQLVITVNLPLSMIEFYEVYEAVLKDAGKIGEIENLKQHIYEKRKPLHYTLDLIVQAGFSIQNVYQDVFNLRFVDGTTMFNHCLIKLAFADSWKAILKETEVESIFHEIENRLNQNTRHDGEIKLTIPWVCIDARRE